MCDQNIKLKLLPLRTGIAVMYLYTIICTLLLSLLFSQLERELNFVWILSYSKPCPVHQAASFCKSWRVEEREADQVGGDLVSINLSL